MHRPVAGNMHSPTLIFKHCLKNSIKRKSKVRSPGSELRDSGLGAGSSGKTKVQAQGPNPKSRIPCPDRRMAVFQVGGWNPLEHSSRQLSWIICPDDSPGYRQNDRGLDWGWARSPRDLWGIHNQVICSLRRRPKSLYRRCARRLRFVAGQKKLASKPIM